MDKSTMAAAPLLNIDRKARDAFKPYRKTAAIKTLAWFGQAGDQLQLRILVGGVFALGMVRGDPRLMRAAVRMLVSHELATLAKKAVKNRVDRWRPRDARNGKEVKPHKGHSRAKALNSFPSGHSAGAVAVACAFAAEYPEHRRPAFAAAGAVTLAQVPTCAHYPTDVAAGAVLGVVTNALVGLPWGLTVRTLSRWRERGLQLN